MDKKRVYTFGNGQAEGKADMKNLLGGKGANRRTGLGVGFFRGRTLPPKDFSCQPFPSA